MIRIAAKKSISCDAQWFLLYSSQYPSPNRRGLYLRSTATRHTGEGVPLWLHRVTHPGHRVTLGQLTSAPSWSSLAGPGAFAS